MQNGDLVRTKTFQELSEGLQSELRELVSWDQRTVGIGGDRPPPPGMWDLSDMTARMRLRTDVSGEGNLHCSFHRKSNLSITSCSSKRRATRSRLHH